MTGYVHDGESRKTEASPCFAGDSFYNEEVTLTHVIPAFVESVVVDPDFEFELLFIDDHSTDRTPLILKDFCQRYPGVRAIRLGRNCGSHMAYRAGLEFARAMPWHSRWRTCRRVSISFGNR